MREKPCISLLDIHLPGKNGIELLKDLADGKALPALMMTNQADEYPAFCYNEMLIFL